MWVLLVGGRLTDGQGFPLASIGGHGAPLLGARAAARGRSANAAMSTPTPRPIVWQPEPPFRPGRFVCTYVPEQKIHFVCVASTGSTILRRVVTISQLAKRQLADYDRHKPGTLFEDQAIELTVAESYALQFEIAHLREARGESVAGYKIGCISPVMQAQLGLDQPVFGQVFDTELHPCGVTLALADYDGLAIEGEFAVRVGEDVRGFASEFAVIELHNYVIRRPPLTAQELIANNAIHAGVVLPREQRRFLRGPAELLDESIAIFRNGENLGTATGGALPDGPLGSIARLVQHLERYEKSIYPGQIILTGSPLPLYSAERADRFEVRCQHLAEVTALISEKSSRGGRYWPYSD
jgi:2-keto-4-pentenoate hydratase